MEKTKLIFEIYHLKEIIYVLTILIFGCLWRFKQTALQDFLICFQASINDAQTLPLRRKLIFISSLSPPFYFVTLERDVSFENC